MSDVRKVSIDQVAKPKSSVNWPVWIAAGLCIAFVVGVWVNNYRVTSAATVPAPIAAKK